MARAKLEANFRRARNEARRIAANIAELPVVEGGHGEAGAAGGPVGADRDPDCSAKTDAKHMANFGIKGTLARQLTFSSAALNYRVASVAILLLIAIRRALECN